MCWMNVSEGIYAWYFKLDRCHASVCFTYKHNENKIKDNNKRSISTLRKERWANIFATFSALWPSLRKSSSSGMFFLASSTNHMNAKSGKSQWTTLTNTFEWHLKAVLISSAIKQLYTNKTNTKAHCTFLKLQIWAGSTHEWHYTITHC